MGHSLDGRHSMSRAPRIENWSETVPSKHTLSVIIPTLNEALYLPHLLEALLSQTRPPDEIIVADAGSSDATAAVAQEYGANVVPGGTPSVGRNAGAAVARGELILFLDADVLPPADFTEQVLAEFEQRELDVATCLVQPLGAGLGDHLVHEAVNAYMLAISLLSPHASGCCLLAWRELHEAMGGFDESFSMAEDHDYVRRARRLGRFGVLTRVRVPVSTRRLAEEGFRSLAVKYTWAELHYLMGRPIRTLPFEYAFGRHSASTSVIHHP